MQVDRLVERWLGEGDGRRLLDVGCGTGFHLARWTELGFRCVGVEPAPAMLAKARAGTNGCALAQGDAARLPFVGAHFDVVTSIEVLRYMSSPEAHVTELYRVLKPGGVCLLTAAPRYSLHGFALAHRASRLIGAGRFGCVPHRFDTVSSLERLCETAGFRAIDVRGAFLGPFVLTEKIAPRMSERILRRWEPIDQRLTSGPGLRNLCNHLVVRAVK
jgi:ubiquinone/menaquinone biosynthesis C-methylase UbiE